MHFLTTRVTGLHLLGHQAQSSTWSLPGMPMSLSPGQLLEMMPTVKCASTSENPSREGKATEDPDYDLVDNFTESDNTRQRDPPGCGQ